MDDLYDASRAISADATGLRSTRDVVRASVALSDGRCLAYAEAGAGPPVVLIHGTLSLLEDMWLALAPVLLPQHRVIAFDRPGHGSSKRRRLVDASPWRQADLIREGLDRLEIKRPILVGHSYGATVALCHGLAHPSATAGIVALAPACFPEPRLEQLLFGPRSVPAFGDGLARMLAAGLDPVLLPLLWHAIFLPQAMPSKFASGFPFARAMGPEHMSVEGEDALAASPALIRAALAYGTCRVPVRIFGGTADIVVNNALQGFVAAQMMPEARFDWVPGIGHMLHHFAADTVVEAVRGLRETTGRYLHVRPSDGSSRFLGV